MPLNKVVLITGASSGIGAGIARELGAAGARLMLGARRTYRLGALCEGIRSSSARQPARMRQKTGTYFHRSYSAIAVAVLLGMASATAHSQTIEDRQQRGDAVVRSLNNGAPQPTLERMRREFPFLAEATEGYALGEVWSRPDLDNRTRQLAAVAVFAAMGETALMKVHAGYALNIGVSEDELKEIIYMVTVPAGFPRAIAASQTLSELFAERRAAPGKQP